MMQAGGYPMRCLPLVIANQAGWMVLSDHTLDATWDGTALPEGLQIEYLEGPEPYPAVSQFGWGILTFTIPLLFRTPPGCELAVRGPTNWPKDGAVPLDGVIETDWLPYTFTMNWQLTRPNHTVRFAANEPICMISPCSLDALEAIHFRVSDISDAPIQLQSEFISWAGERAERRREPHDPDHPERPLLGYYLQGRTPAGERAHSHRRKLRLRQPTDGSIDSP